MKKTFLCLSKNFNKLRLTLIYDETRAGAVVAGINVVLAFVALLMSAINIFTSEYILMISTLIFALLCILNIVFIEKRLPENFIFFLFVIEVMALMAFFYISGIPDGFSSIWICLIPSFAMLAFGMKRGSGFSLAALAMMIFFFWIPQGRALLRYDYSPTFMLRFPFLYTAIFILSLLLEYIRRETHDRLVEAERKYRYLYRHDALTGLYNRHGMNEHIDKAFENPENRSLAVMILDIDFFKNVNDRYGHDAGDEVLRLVANLPRQVLCDHCKYGRWGGEEFLILMQCSHDPVQIAERVRSLVEGTTLSYKSHKINVTVSIGVCIANDISKISIAQLINQADKCLYTAKENGRNQVVCSTFH